VRVSSNFKFDFIENLLSNKSFPDYYYSDILDFIFVNVLSFSNSSYKKLKFIKYSNL
jgi:hypothetical protein